MNDNKSLKTMKLDLAILFYVHNLSTKGIKVVRQKEILTQFNTYSKSTIRLHLKHLCAVHALEVTDFKGSYRLGIGGYESFQKDVCLFTEALLGPDLWRCLKDGMRHY